MHPVGYEPMLASSAPRYLELGQWAFEPKLDGWRAIVHVGDGRLSVYSRPGRDLRQSLPQLASLLDAVPAGTVLDGELVVGSGRAATFYRLAPGLHAKRDRVTFAAFDVLALASRSVVSAPYEERKRMLADLGLLGPAWCTLPHWTDVELSDLLAACEAHGIEGVVAKRLRSAYRPGRRSDDWRKIKTLSWRSEHAPLRRPRS